MKKLLAKAMNSSIRTRLVMIFTLIIGIFFIVNIAVYNIINTSLNKINSVYSSNITTNELSDALQNVQTNVYEYLNTRSAEALEDYYRYEDEYNELIENLYSKNTDNGIFMLQKNIRSMSQTYLNLSEKTIQAKRGRNVEKYKEYYERSTDIYNYIKEYISILNNSQFKENSDNYIIMLESLRMSEVISFAVIILIAVLSVLILLIVVRNITGPLVALASTANEIAQGNLETKLLETESDDEIGVVTKAFNAMVISLRHYVEQMKFKMETERKMKEHQLLMETHLKDAQLKYLQAQINPHFLFNCLNAGAQLAMMEDAENTSVFVQKMADFFRYNVKKMKDDATLSEEIASVDNYIYILNVRYAGDIKYVKNINLNTDSIRIPSMILQPLVENAVNHGIRNLEDEKIITLCVYEQEDNMVIEVWDNGEGMTTKKIDEVMRSIEIDGKAESESTGIGLGNVISRLELYYNTKNLFKIESSGVGLGTKVTILIPEEKGEDYD